MRRLKKDARLPHLKGSIHKLRQEIEQAIKQAKFGRGIRMGWTKEVYNG